VQKNEKICSGQNSFMPEQFQKNVFLAFKSIFMVSNLPGKKFLPHLIILAAFLLLIFSYMTPLLQGKRLDQSDMNATKGMAEEIHKYNESGDEATLWTNSMFSGMPAYMIYTPHPMLLVKYIGDFLYNWIPQPASLVFVYLLGFYLLGLCFGWGPWLSAAGAIAYAFASYNFIILEAGHVNKALAIGLMPPVIGGVHLAFRNRFWLGGAVTALALALEIYANHLQITYYLMFIVVFQVLAELIFAIRQGQILPFVKTSGLLLGAALVAVGANGSKLWITYEYSQETIRGKSEISGSGNESADGLDKEYALAWSYGKAETMTLLIPNFYGGASGNPVGKKSESYKFLKQNGYGDKEAQIVPTYWGAQPFTSGPVYIGATVCFLFVLGLFLISGPLRVWIIAATILSLLLSWGKNFVEFTDIFFYYVPMYNKFRAVAMILVIAGLTLPLLGFEVVSRILSGSVSKEKIIRALKYAVGITAGICLLFVLLPGMLLDFQAEGDSRYPEAFVNALISDREMLLRNDALRSIAFILGCAGLILAFALNKIKKEFVIGGLALLVLIDLWAVDKRYLNEDRFVRKEKTETPYEKSAADEMILKDKDLSYRVLNLTSNTFNEAGTSFFHKSIGGYHAAKLRRYQDLIERRIKPEIESVSTVLKGQPTEDSIRIALAACPTLNMLNTRYLILSSSFAYRNPFAYGNAWFVNSLNEVKDANGEIGALNTLNPMDAAVLTTESAQAVGTFTPFKDSLSTIKLLSYSPNILKYESQNAGEGFAVFSEVYYEPGWNLYVDGKSTPLVRVNYVLRGAKIPSGKHILEMKFEPETYSKGELISLVFSIILLGWIGFAVYSEGKNSKK